MVIVSENGVIKIPRKKVESILHDPAKTARAVHLVYVNDQEAGILRIRKGKKFIYQQDDKPVKAKSTLQRINKLVIPPAWENVWICSLENGHLQATGTDIKNRKQYKYHPLWNALRNHTKFYRLHDFGKALPAIRLQLEKHLALPQLPFEKVMALLVSLLERTNIRVGNTLYEKLYGSFGLSTMKDKHVKIEGNAIRFSFKGKKGIQHDINFKSKRLSKIVQACKDIPGQELFQYEDSNGNRHSIDSGMINNYIKTLSGGEFTAKDFRTWAGSVQAIMAFKELGMFETQTEAKRKIVEVLDRVSQQLGNTRTVCKKYYVHPTIITLYEKSALDVYIQQLEKMEADDNVAGLTSEENILMKILENN